MWRVALANTQSASDFFWDNNTTKVINSSDFPVAFIYKNSFVDLITLLLSVNKGVLYLQSMFLSKQIHCVSFSASIFLIISSTSDPKNLYSISSVLSILYPNRTSSNTSFKTSSNVSSNHPVYSCQSSICHT